MGIIKGATDAAKEAMLWGDLYRMKAVALLLRLGHW